MIPVYLSGGSGTRLWPISRASFPKQFMPIHGKESLLQKSILRLSKYRTGEIASPIVLCHEDQRFLVAEQIKQLGISNPNLILEPCAKNTAAAIAAAVCWATMSGNDPILAVFPSDHLIEDEQAFHNAIYQAEAAAKSGNIVTLGVVPTGPETGFGYIQSKLDAKNSALDLIQFIEKPNHDEACRLIAAGDCFWNAGIFIFKASVMLNQLRKYSPEILMGVQSSVKKAVIDNDFIRLHQADFEQVPSISIDVAVMEKTDIAKVVPIEVGWNDIGSWAAWWRAGSSDQSGNVLSGDVVALDTTNTLVEAQTRLVAVKGLTDMVVVETSDAVLVMPRSESQSIRELVVALQKNNRNELNHSSKFFRPWGGFESLAKGVGYQVKRLTVNPHGRLSLQYHNHRAEHWIVVHGTAKVTIGQETFFLNENESTYIPHGVAHRLENPSENQLEVIEVQSGDYLGEDDIVRIEDQYGRSNN